MDSSDVVLHPPHNRGCLNAESGGNEEENADSRVLDTSFYLADVGGVQVALECKTLLGVLGLQPQVRNYLPNGLV